MNAESREAASQILIAGRREYLRMTPREQAVAAHCAGGPSVDELERRITERRVADARAQTTPWQPPDMSMFTRQERLTLAKVLDDDWFATPRQQAESSHFVGGPSLDELERRFIEYRRADAILGNDRGAAAPSTE